MHQCPTDDHPELDRDSDLGERQCGNRQTPHPGKLAARLSFTKLDRFSQPPGRMEVSGRTSGTSGHQEGNLKSSLLKKQ